MSDVLARIDELEAKLRGLETELAELRREAAPAATAAVAVEPEPVATPPPPPPPPPPAAAPPRPAAAPVYTTSGVTARRAPQTPRDVPASPAPRKPRFEIPEFDLAAWVGARGLAWVGGLVTLLGIVFFFVLAVNRGWVSAELRVALGALVSAGLYGAAWWIYKRLGALDGALAAAGAGIAGAYATLLAATAMYDFVPTPVALLISAGIAAVGIATALVWNAQITAILGLVGAMLGPELIEAGEPSSLGAVYVAIVFAAAAVVALRRGWFETLAIAGAMCAIESTMLLTDRDPGESVLAAALGGVFALLYLAAGVGARLRPTPKPKLDLLRGDVLPAAFLALSGATAVGISAQLDSSSAPGGSIAVVAALWLSYLVAGVGLQVQSGSTKLTRLPTALLLFSVSYAFVSTFFAFDADAVGWALLVVAAVTAAPILPLLARKGHRDLVTVLWAAALAVLASAIGNLLGGNALVFAWAAQGGLLAWVAVITREWRLQFASMGYLGLALSYTLINEARPEDLFRVTASPESAIPAVLFVSAGLAAFALAARAGSFRPTEGGLVATALSGAGVLYAASFGLLAILEFWKAEVAITTMLAVVGFAVVLPALLRTFELLHLAGLAVYGAAVAKLFFFDLPQLSTRHGAWSLLIVGASALAIGYVEGLWGERVAPFVDRNVRLTLASAALLPASAAGMLVALSRLLDGSTADINHQGAALIGLGALYAALAATVFGRPGRRDLATLLWALGAVLAAIGFAAYLLDGSALVLAWAVTGAALAVLARLTREERFLVGSVALVAASLLLAVANTPPEQLVDKSATPATGVAGIVFAGLGLAVLTLCLPDGQYRRIGAWATGAVALYAGSLAILGLFEWPAANNADAVAAAFQRGHTAVSAAWGLVGLVLLVVGLRRDRRALRLGGLALFGLALVKIFAYDLANLSSLARAFSFLVVGAVLLVAALVYQRLSEASSRGTARPG